MNLLEYDYIQGRNSMLREMIMAVARPEGKNGAVWWLIAV